MHGQKNIKFKEVSNYKLFLNTKFSSVYNNAVVV